MSQENPSWMKCQLCKVANISKYTVVDVTISENVDVGVGAPFSIEVCRPCAVKIIKAIEGISKP